MKILNNLVSGSVALALLGVLCVCSYFGLQLILDLFAGLEERVGRVIRAAFVAAAFIALLISIILRWGQKRKSIAQPEKYITIGVNDLGGYFHPNYSVLSTYLINSPAVVYIASKILG